MKLPKGVQQDRYGFRIFVRRNGTLHTQRLPAGSTLTELKTAREKLIGAILHDLTTTTATAGQTFAHEAAEYLTLIHAMPIYSDRARHIGQWVEAFGRRDRATITPRDITKQLEKWRATGSATGGPLKPATLNLMRTALQHLYSKLDGKAAKNIVKDVARYDERYNKKLRAQPMAVCEQIVNQLRAGSKGRAIMDALLWTGWTNQFLKDIKPEHVDWTHGRVTLVARKKGQGMDEDVVPVVPRALKALRHLDAHGWLGTDFSNSSLWRAVANAGQKVSAMRRAEGLNALPPINVYVFRHSFGTWAAEHVKDDRTLKLMLRTNSIERYTRGANQARMEAARDQLVAALRPPRQKAPVEVRVEPPTARRALPSHVTR